MRRIFALVPFLSLAFVLIVLTGCSSGTSSNSSQTNNPAPTIVSISPSSLNAGAAAQNITITGTGYTSGSVVLFSGTPLQTTYTSSTSLQAAVPASLLANGQTASIQLAGYVVPGNSVTFTPPNPPPNTPMPVSGLFAVVDVPAAEDQPLHLPSIVAAIANTLVDNASPWGLPWSLHVLAASDG